MQALAFLIVSIALISVWICFREHFQHPHIPISHNGLSAHHACKFAGYDQWMCLRAQDKKYTERYGHDWYDRREVRRV